MMYLKVVHIDITRINQINEQVKVIKDQQKSKEEQQTSLEH